MMIDKLLQCFYVPDFITFLITISIFVVIYIGYLALLFLFRRIFHEEKFSRKLVEKLKWPILFILIEVTALSFVNLLVVADSFKRGIIHFIIISIVCTLGWVLIAVTTVSFFHFIRRLKKDSEKDHTARSLLTQILFLYRLLILFIVVVTASTILMTFPYIRAFGIGILGSAGILGVALGIAARPILLNIMAGFQIAFTKTIKIGDSVFLEGEVCRIESMHLTHVVARTWDLRRIVLPISYFIDHTFQNWDLVNPEKIGTAFIHCDFRMPVQVIREKVNQIVKETPFWNEKVVKLEVIEAKEQSIKIKIIAGAKNSVDSADLCSYIREKLLEFLQNEYADMLPCQRIYTQATIK